MKTFEKILIVIAIIGLIFRFLYIPGAFIIMFASLMTLAVLYFLLGFALFNNLKVKDLTQKATYNSMNNIRLIGAIFTGLALSTIVIGILFKIFRWPGGNIQILSGIVAIIAILIVSAIKGGVLKSTFYKPIQIRLFAYLFVGVALFLASDYWIEQIKFHNHPEYLELYIEYQKNPDDEELRKELEDARAVMIFGDDTE
jgi:hypothetical protein